MWTLSYLLLLLVRLYFTFSPSYLHPDEHFQGPEVIAGQNSRPGRIPFETDLVFVGEIFSYPAQRTWEWTSTHPIRSVFPIWPLYGLPMTLLKWVWAEDNQGTVSPENTYYALRLVMFILTFVLEDWAIHELVHSPRHRRQAVLLVASAWPTWTFQSHTFSNSIETLLVAWSLVLIERIVASKVVRSFPSYG
jgi:GPI mannosyltransferase 4